MKTPGLDRATKEALRQVVQADLFPFAKHILGYRDMTEGFHRPLCEQVQTTPYAKNLYLLPRDFFKTSLITVARSIQRILQNPDVRILIASNKAQNAESMLREIKAHLADPQLIALFPEILFANPATQAEQWTNAAITVKRSRRAKEATVETIGVEGELTSKHYDHAVFDDLVGLENSQTRDQLLRTILWWRTAQGLMEPEATQDIVGTPWHYADLYAWLQEQRGKHGLPLGFYRRAVWDIGAQGERIPTFPERWSLERLEEERATQGASVFAAQRLLDPMDEETTVFPRKAILPFIHPRRELPPLGSLWIAMTVDPAISTKAWADYTAIAVGGFGRDGVEYLLDLRRGKWTESQVIDQLYEMWARTPGIRMIGIEAIGFQKIYLRLLRLEGDRRGFHLPALALERDTRIGKNIRIRALEPRWMSGRLVLASDLPALEDFLDEAERFRLTKESVHDDLLDAVVDLEQLRRRPFSEPPESTLEDPEWQERREFEQGLLQESPGFDRSSLRHAWAIHRVRTQQEAERELAVLGADTDEFWS